MSNKHKNYNNNNNWQQNNNRSMETFFLHDQLQLAQSLNSNQLSNNNFLQMMMLSGGRSDYMRNNMLRNDLTRTMLLKLKDHDNAITLMQSKGNSEISTLTKAVNDLAVNQQKIANNLNVIQNTISIICCNFHFCRQQKVFCNLHFT